jgi:molybdate transport system ATP-binding protein
MINIRSVYTIKSGKKIFEDLSWTINKNEHWVISGKNGSGKTLLLELLAGHTHPVQGNIEYDFIKGDSWDKRFTERKQTIHYVTAHAIQIFLSGHELFYQQRYYSIGDERVPIVSDIFEGESNKLSNLRFPPSFDIEALLQLPVTRLSNGQLKKVLILKNLVKEIPRLLLLDYPFEGLDYVSRQELSDFIDHLAKNYPITIVLVDHDHHLPSVINRKLVLDNFKIVSAGIFHPTDQHPRSKKEIPSNHPLEEKPVVQMENVTIRYGQKEIIKNFNWKILRGERWALTGKNGSGKTTLFSMIFADHPMAYSEKVYLFGKRRGSGESIWDIKKRISYLGPEFITYLNSKNITTTVYEFIQNQNKNLSTKQLLENANQFSTIDFLDRPVKELSSGQLQLIFVLQSLLSDKELILLDEPFQFLDPQAKAEVNNYLQRKLSQNTTLVLITHYESDIENWTQRRMHLG